MPLRLPQQVCACVLMCVCVCCCFFFGWVACNTCVLSLVLHSTKRAALVRNSRASNTKAATRAASTILRSSSCCEYSCALLITVHVVELTTVDPHHTVCCCRGLQALRAQAKLLHERELTLSAWTSQLRVSGQQSQQLGTAATATMSHSTMRTTRVASAVTERTLGAVGSVSATSVRSGPGYQVGTPEHWGMEGEGGTSYLYGTATITPAPTSVENTSTESMDEIDPQVTCDDDDAHADTTCMASHNCCVATAQTRARAVSRVAQDLEATAASTLQLAERVQQHLGNMSAAAAASGDSDLVLARDGVAQIVRDVQSVKGSASALRLAPSTTNSDAVLASRVWEIQTLQARLQQSRETLRFVPTHAWLCLSRMQC